MDFFISYTQADRQWAVWIAAQLEAAGYTTFVQAWDIRPGSNFVIEMQKATAQADRTIAVLSQKYLDSEFALSEWTAAFARDPTGAHGILVPVRVQRVELRGVWPQIVYIDLVGLSAEDARLALLSGVQRGRAKPSSSPTFPAAPLPTYPAADHAVTLDALRDWRVLDIVTMGSESTLGFLFRPARERVVETTRTTLSQSQLRLVETLIDSAQHSTSFSAELRQTLFELLLPNPLKRRLPTVDWLYVVVDAAAARYPWELVLAGPEQLSETHFARMSLLRRLQVSEFWETQSATSRHRALVIGNPRTSSRADLPGALFEAEAVVQILEAGGYSVRSVLNKPDIDNITALFAEPYDILHVSTHGVYDEQNPSTRGLVLGDEIVLTSTEISQMPTVPPLVFVNVGHSGILESDNTDAAHFGKLGAHLAETFIIRGSRAVVVSGWAVDDFAAREFASEYYTGILAHKSFADVVGAARTSTFLRFPLASTWAAFQCYGSPDFRA